MQFTGDKAETKPAPRAEGEVSEPSMTLQGIARVVQTDDAGNPVATAAAAADATNTLIQTLTDTLVGLVETLRVYGMPVNGGALTSITNPITVVPQAGVALAAKQSAPGTVANPSPDVQTIQGAVGGQPQAVDVRDLIPMTQQMIDLLALLPTNTALSVPAAMRSMRAVNVSNTQAVRLLEVNTNRKSVVIVNNSTGTLYLGNTSAVTSSGTTAGYTILASGGSYSDSGDGRDLGETWGIYSAAASAANVIVDERS